MYVLKKFFSPWAEPGVLRVEAEELREAAFAPQRSEDKSPGTRD